MGGRRTAFAQSLRLALMRLQVRFATRSRPALIVLGASVVAVLLFSMVRLPSGGSTTSGGSSGIGVSAVVLGGSSALPLCFSRSLASSLAFSTASPVESATSGPVGPLVTCGRTILAC
jgi:hypothetical protein